MNLSDFVHAFAFWLASSALYLIGCLILCIPAATLVTTGLVYVAGVVFLASLSALVLGIASAVVGVRKLRVK